MRWSLEAAGILARGTVAPLAAGLVAVVLRPQLRVAVEVLRGGAVVTHRARATPEVAVVGRSVADDVVEYAFCDPLALPFGLAALVSLGQGAAPGDRRPVTLTVGALEAATDLVERGLTAEAAGALRAAGLAEADADAVVRIVAGRRMTWRAGSAWADDAGRVHEGAVTVVDAGPEGLWCSSAAGDGDQGPGCLLRLAPLTAAQAWWELVALMPRRSQEPAAATAPAGG
ncbi:MAG TPA: hypothetical protein VFO65_02125 [Acidimicrobiales bacterium]|nr:hypothetical protein [Acidimicrobiales bacterium]